MNHIIHVFRSSISNRNYPNINTHFAYTMPRQMQCHSMYRTLLRKENTNNLDFCCQWRIDSEWFWGQFQLEQQHTGIILLCTLDFNMAAYEMRKPNAPSLITYQFIKAWWHIKHSVILVIISSNNGLSPARHQTTVWTNACLLSSGHVGTNFYLSHLPLDKRATILADDIFKCIF